MNKDLKKKKQSQSKQPDYSSFTTSLTFIAQSGDKSLYICSCSLSSN